MDLYNFPSTGFRDEVVKMGIRLYHYQDGEYGRNRSLEERVIISTLRTCFSQNVALSFSHNTVIFIVIFSRRTFLRYLA